MPLASAPHPSPGVAPPALRPPTPRTGAQILVTDTGRNLVAGKDYRFHDHSTHELKGFEESARLFEVGWA